jgi:hypothetical protein
MYIEHQKPTQIDPVLDLSRSWIKYTDPRKNLGENCPTKMMHCSWTSNPQVQDNSLTKTLYLPTPAPRNKTLEHYKIYMKSWSSSPWMNTELTLQWSSTSDDEEDYLRMPAPRTVRESATCCTRPQRTGSSPTADCRRRFPPFRAASLSLESLLLRIWGMDEKRNKPLGLVPWGEQEKKPEN